MFALSTSITVGLLLHFSSDSLQSIIIIFISLKVFVRAKESLQRADIPDEPWQPNGCQGMRSFVFCFHLFRPKISYIPLHLCRNSLSVSSPDELLHILRL